MSPSIEVDEEIFDVLKRNAEIFVDSPNTVLRRLLGLDTSGHHDLVQPSPQNGSDQISEQPARQTRATTRRPDRDARPKHRRAAAGTLLPESEFEMPILRYLDQHNGRAPSREVVDAIGVELAARLTDADKEPLNSGEIRWKSRAAFVRLRLVERGDLDGQAPRGTWQLSEQGRKRVRAER